MATINSEALNELNSSEARTIFDTADKLSALGVERIVTLPQIIVVGDPSSGKSSVLEAISHVHFPVKGGVCTQFATELVLRPGTRRSIAATVRFADGTSPARSLNIADFNQEDIHGIIEDAKDKMGISGNISTFSKDVLRLEIEGPGMLPLTLVDLPGIFPAGTAKQSVEGQETVMELVRSYMRKPNSIILAIVSANNQLASQATMQEATKYDPAKGRTLGVITKPDLVPRKSWNETEYLQLVQGLDHVYNLALGWHVLRNRADYEVDAGSRETIEEEFFKSGPWASISATNRGVTSLRAKLSRVLLEHIKKGLPVLLEDLQNKLFDRQVELDQLGPPRNLLKDMRSYLIDIASSFERLVHDGIQGRYNDPFYHGVDGTDWRLRAQLRNLSKALRHVFLKHGCSQEVIERPDWGRIRLSVAPAYLKEFLESNGYTENLPRPKPITWAKLNSWLEREAAAHQGTEFPGYVNMDIVMRLFQSQSKPWQCIAERHIETVLRVTKAYVEAVFEHIIGPFSSNSTTRAILSGLVDDYFDAKEQALSTKLKELLRPYQDGYALPIDADFHEAMNRRTAERATFSSDDAVKLDLQGNNVASSGEFGTERIVDTVQTFYDMALQTFTDNVTNLAVESCLVQDLPNIFTPRQVSTMDISMLEKLAAESQDVRSSRSRLEEDIRLLKEGLERCRPYKPRAMVNAPSYSNATSLGPQGKTFQTLPGGAVKVELPPSDHPADHEAHPVPPAASITQKPARKPSPATIFDQPTGNATLFSYNDPPGTGLFGSKPYRPSESGSEAMQATVGGERPVSVLADISKQQGQNSRHSQQGSWFSGPSSAIPATTTNKTTPLPESLFGSPSTPSPSSGTSAAESQSSGVSSPAATTSPISKATTSGTAGPFAEYSQTLSNPFADAIAKSTNGSSPGPSGFKPSGLTQSSTSSK